MILNLIPHADIALTYIRTGDVCLLLSLGALFELLTRLILLHIKYKPVQVRNQEGRLKELQKQAHLKQQLGPSAFVEASKLERQVLALQKELTQTAQQRQQRIEYAERILRKHVTYGLWLLVFVLYYSVPVVTLDALAVPNTLDAFVPADTYLKCLLFPVSVFGMGNKLSKWGISKPEQTSSLSALMVMWSSQSLVGMIMDAVESLLLCS